MKKKNIVAILLILISLIFLMLIIDTPKEQLDKLKENILKTKSVVVYGGISSSDEYIEYSKQKYNKYNTITNEEDVKEIIAILSKVEISNGTVTTNMPDYVFYLLDDFGNQLAEFTLNPFTSSIISTTIKDTGRLYEIFEKDKLGHRCFTELDTYIYTDGYSFETVDINNITDKNNFKYSRIITTSNGYIYALISTDDFEVIKDFDSYFKENYKGYIKKELADNSILYIYNNQKEINEEKISSCIELEEDEKKK